MHGEQGIRRGAARTVVGRQGPLLLVVLSGALLAGTSLRVAAAEEIGGSVTAEEVESAMRRAAAYFRGNVARHGGYAYYASPELDRRWGEGEAGPDTIFVEPPGTPTVGHAFLRAHEATGDPFHLDAAREAGEALARGQLRSGGWTQVIHFAPVDPPARMGDYRLGGGGTWNASSLDDDQTPAALQFLMRLDAALNFDHAEIREAVRVGLDALLAAQFPNGGFPQVWRAPVEPQPVLPARYPDEDWRTAERIKNYWDHYTLNDGIAGNVLATLQTAWEVYGDPRCREAIARLGDFLLLARMPEPQPAWCQQYDFTMAPMWARRFEPPAIASVESRDALMTLIRIARFLDEPRYLEPLPAALDYFEMRCLLPDGRVPRFLELRTNRPLYFDRDYQPTYDDAEAPDHYSWKRRVRWDRVRAALEAARRGQAASDGEDQKKDESRDEDEDEEEGARRGEAAARVIAALDDQGRWVTEHDGRSLPGQPPFQTGDRFLSSADFSRNLTTLSRWLDETKEK